MPRKRIYTVLLVAMTVGAMFAIGTYRYVKASPATATPVNVAHVVVANGNMDVGTALRAEDLRVIDWPAKSVPEGAFQKTDELVGRGLIQPVVAFEPIVPGKLSSPEAGAGLPPIIPEGMRALSVRVNDVIGVAGYVLPGTRVDVLVTVSPDDQHDNVTSKLILPKGTADDQNAIAALIRHNDRLGMNVRWASDLRKEINSVYAAGKSIAFLPADPSPATIYEGGK